MRLFAWLLTLVFGAPKAIGPNGPRRPPTGDPLMLRWHLGTWFGRDYRVHHILRPDNGPDPHDHPYAFTSRVLKGWLEETVFDPGPGQTTRRTPFMVSRVVYEHLQWFHHRGIFLKSTFPATHTHLITAVSPGGCWTLVSARASNFVAGAAWERVWGFWTDKGFVPYDRYDGGDR